MKEKSSSGSNRLKGIDSPDVLARKVKAASDSLAHASTETKNKVLGRLEAVAGENVRIIFSRKTRRTSRQPKRQASRKAS